MQRLRTFTGLRPERCEDADASRGRQQILLLKIAKRWRISWRSSGFSHHSNIPCEVLRCVKHSGNNDLPAINEIEDSIWESLWKKLAKFFVIKLADPGILFNHIKSVVHGSSKRVAQALLLQLISVLRILQIGICLGSNGKGPLHRLLLARSSAMTSRQGVPVFLSR